MVVPTAPLQTSLWSGDAPEVSLLDDVVERTALTRGAWVDHAPGWLAGSDTVFAACLGDLPWQRGERWMYDRVVAMPRCWSPMAPDAEGWMPVFAQTVDALTAHYGTPFTSCGANLYRDGDDSVAWHGDRIGRDRLTSLVAVVSVGQPRRFLLRPRGGGPSRRFDLGHGDLLVMGGTCQRTWEHTVPKARGVGPRISLTFRLDADGPVGRLSPAVDHRDGADSTGGGPDRGR